MQACGLKRTADLVGKALRDQAGECGTAPFLWLALDGALSPTDVKPTECEERLHGELMDRDPVKIRLRHPQVDPIWSPRWFALDAGQASDSFLLQDSIELALEELRPERIEQGRGRRISGWLRFQGPVGAVAERIGSLMIQRRGAGDTRLLRLHDPAVLWGVWPLLTRGQQARWLEGVQAWWMLDPAGNLVALRASTEPTEEPLTSAQWSVIECVTPLNCALREWLPSVPQQSAESLDRMRVVAMRALHRARAYGLVDLQDLTLFAKHAMTIHPEFDQHETVRQLLERRADDDHYTALIEVLTEQDWRVVQTSASPT